MPLSFTVSAMRGRRFTVVVMLVCVMGTVAMLPWLHRKWQLSRTDNLLNQAYSSRRTLDLRFAGAKFAPLQRTRGGNNSLPLPLIEAEAEIAEHEGEGDPEWGRLRGRAMILRGEPEQAIAALERAHEFQPHSVPIMIDLALAYAQRAEFREIDTSNFAALEMLGVVLTKEPDNQVALFNSAILKEKQFLYREAVDDWQKFLDTSPGPWSAEALAHVTTIRQKLHDHESALSQKLLNLDEFTASLNSNREITLSRVEERIEEYVDVLIEQWLPQAESRGPDPETAAALHILAIHLLQKHNDPWLRDFLASVSDSRRKKEATALLARAYLANIEGNWDDARQLAAAAKEKFLAMGFTAGELSATVEEIKALRQPMHTDECIAAVENVGRKIADKHYWVLQTQFLLEKASCLVRHGKQDSGLQAVHEADNVVHQARLPSQYINVLNYEASIDKFNGDFSATCRISSEALRAFWIGLYPDKRAYPFYAKLADWAEENDKPNVFLAFTREAARTLDPTGLFAYKGLAHMRVAEAASANGLSQLAQSEFLQADKSFAELHDQSSSKNRASVEILLARLEAQRGEDDHAMDRLGKVEPTLKELDSFLPQYQFYSTRAAIYTGRSQNGLAEDEYRRAISAAEKFLPTIKSENERLTWSKQYGPAYRGLAQVLLRENRPADALEVWESYSGVDLRSFMQSGGGARQSDTRPPNAMRLADLQRQLGDQTALVYMFTNDGMAIWIVTQSGIKSRLLRTDHKKLEALASRLVFLCGDPQNDISSLRSTAASLYRALYQPVESVVRSTTVVIEPDSELDAVPFEVLLDGQGRYLADRLRINYLPSIVFLNYLRPKTEFSSSSTLAVGVAGIAPEYRNIFRPLPDAEREAATIAQVLPQTQLLTGKQADESHLLEWLARSNIFHFAGHSAYEHGRFNLLLAPDARTGQSLMDFGGVFRTSLQNMQLVVLSACSSRGASGESFHDPENVVRLTLQAGVPQMIASHWDIDSTTTADLMEEFYRRFAFNKDVSGSLAYAMEKIRSRHPHPYYWAAFSQFGRN